MAEATRNPPARGKPHGIKPGFDHHLTQHPGQHQDLDRRHLLAHLVAAVVELVAVLVVGAGGATASRSRSWVT